MAYLPEDQASWLQRALIAVPTAAVRDELTALVEAAFAVGYVRGFDRASAIAAEEWLRRVLEAVLADETANPEPQPLIPTDAPLFQPVTDPVTEPAAVIPPMAEEPTAKVKRAPRKRATPTDSALSVLDQGWKPEDGDTK